MNFLRGLGQVSSDLLRNEQVRSAANRVVSSFSSSGEKKEEQKIEVISEKRLRAMLKMDLLTLFSCHSELVSGDHIYFAIFLPESKSVWKSADERAVRELCIKLNPLTDVAVGPSVASRLSSLMQIVWLEPDWAAIHYAISCGFTDYLKSQIAKDRELVLNYATADGRFPLNIAAEKKQTEALRLLLSNGASLAQQDAEGRTVVHWAATADADILAELSAAPSFEAALLLVDGDCASPLSSAIAAANFETVKLLMGRANACNSGLNAPLSSESHAPLLSPLVGKEFSSDFEKIIELITTISPSVVLQADKQGRTILHKGLDKKMLTCLLRCVYCNIDVNVARDSSGETPLHYAVEREDLSAVVLLLTYGSDVNAVNTKQETALMKAVMKSNLLIVKCLLLFDASLDAKNASGQDVFALAASCKQRVYMEALLKLMKTGATDEITELDPMEKFSQELAIKYQASQPADEKTVNLLSLDGGGIRGLVLIQILIELERRLGHPVMDSFSWLGGTSTGAILALALSQGKTPSHCRDLYFRLKDEVFTGSRPYDAAPLESLLKGEYGAANSMGQICTAGKRVLVTTCKGNENPPHLTLFRSYRLPQSDTDNERMGYFDPSTVPAWVAARRSSAAPTYFAAYEGKWMDGGLVANNPCSELLTDVHNHNMVCRMTGDPSNVRIGCVLSLGTGRAPPSSIESVDLAPPRGFAGMLGILKAWDSIVHLKNLLIEQIACADGAAVTRARAWTHSLPAPYFRFSPPLKTNIDLAETNDEILIEMLWETKKYMAEEALSTSMLVDYLEASQPKTE